MEKPIGEQSLLQVTLTLLVIGIYLPIVGLLLYTFLNTFRYIKDFTFGRKGRFWNPENTAWRRFFLIAPIAPLSIFTKELIDDKINITGWWLRNLDFCFDMLAYVSFGGTIILLFEALGRIGSHWILNFKRSKSDLERIRIQNVLLPICRFLGALTAVLVIYQLLLRLGMPSSTVLPFQPYPVWRLAWEHPSCLATSLLASRFSPIGPFVLESSARLATSLASSSGSGCAQSNSPLFQRTSPFPTTRWTPRS